MAKRKTYLIPPDWRKREAKRQEAEAPHRRDGIGGSNAAVVLGVSKFKTAAGLWAEKSGLIETEPWEPEVHSVQYWGVVMEPVLLREFAMDIGKEVVGRWYDQSVVRFMADGSVHRIKDDPFGWMLDTVRGEDDGVNDYSFMTGHVDGVILEDDDADYWQDSDSVTHWRKVIGIVDGKTSNAFMASEWGEPGTDDVPSDYLCQVNHYQEIFRQNLGYDVTAWVAMLLGGMTWRLYKIDYHAELAGIIKEAELAFWNAVHNDGEMPAIELTNKGLDLLKKLYPVEEPDSPIDITGKLEWVGVGDELNDVKLEMSRLKKKKEALEVQFQQRMATASEVVVESRPWRCTWKSPKPKKAVDVKGLLERIGQDHSIPEEDIKTVLEEYTTEKQGARRFTFKAAEPEENEDG
jgi:predicted phage-related endonuclease